MNGFAKRTQTKKQAILEATTKILLEKGYSYLKIEDVAKKANVSQVTIYNYFGSKKAHPTCHHEIYERTF